MRGLKVEWEAEAWKVEKKAKLVRQAPLQPEETTQPIERRMKAMML